jgi:hypothetical protein
MVCSRCRKASSLMLVGLVTAGLLEPRCVHPLREYKRTPSGPLYVADLWREDWVCLEFSLEVRYVTVEVGLQDAMVDSRRRKFFRRIESDAGSGIV